MFEYISEDSSVISPGTISKVQVFPRAALWELPFSPEKT